MFRWQLYAEAILISKARGGGHVAYWHIADLPGCPRNVRC
jgi:hypothetical protein